MLPPLRALGNVSTRLVLIFVPQRFLRFPSREIPVVLFLALAGSSGWRTAEISVGALPYPYDVCARVPVCSMPRVGALGI